MNKLELLNDLKAVRQKHQFWQLDPLIRNLGKEMIQDACKHTETATLKGSCFYGEYEVVICKTCKKEIQFIKNW